MRTRALFAAIAIAFLVTTLVPSASLAGAVEVDQSTSLTIYTYDSLLADPGYDFTSAFESYAGLPNNSVEVVYLEDAGSIVTKAAAEKSNPAADVLIGIDNALVHQARAQDILTPYEPTGSDQLVEGLVDGLASDYLLTPYDYGVISLWYLSSFNTSANLESFDIAALTSSNISSQLIVEDPRLSSPGLGFLLSTIAMFGDDGVEGLVDGDWEDFWASLSSETAMSSSWGDAITRLYDDSSRSMMVSYTTSPAYGNCLYGDNSTRALLPTVNGVQYGWQQIEGLGLVKNAPNADLAKQFIDWFISNELQEQVHQNQWMYSARQGIETPDCFETSIDPSTISPLNDRISQDVLAENLDSWLETWEVSWVGGPEGSEGIFTPFPFAMLGMLVIIPLFRRKFR